MHISPSTIVFVELINQRILIGFSDDTTTFLTLGEVDSLHPLRLKNLMKPWNTSDSDWPR